MVKLVLYLFDHSRSDRPPDNDEAFAMKVIFYFSFQVILSVPALPHCGVRSAWIGAQSPLLHPPVQVLLGKPWQFLLLSIFQSTQQSLGRKEGEAGSGQEVCKEAVWRLWELGAGKTCFGGNLATSPQPPSSSVGTWPLAC